MRMRGVLTSTDLNISRASLQVNGCGSTQFPVGRRQWPVQASAFEPAHSLALWPGYCRCSCCTAAVALRVYQNITVDGATIVTSGQQGLYTPVRFARQLVEALGVELRAGLGLGERAVVELAQTCAPNISLFPSLFLYFALVLNNKGLHVACKSKGVNLTQSKEEE